VAVEPVGLKKPAHEWTGTSGEIWVNITIVYILRAVKSQLFEIPILEQRDFYSLYLVAKN